VADLEQVLQNYTRTVPDVQTDTVLPPARHSGLAPLQQSCRERCLQVLPYEQMATLPITLVSNAMELTDKTDASHRLYTLEHKLSFHFVKYRCPHPGSGPPLQ
jgi:hypothetical protein